VRATKPCSAITSHRTTRVSYHDNSAVWGRNSIHALTIGTSYRKKRLLLECMKNSHGNQSILYLREGINGTAVKSSKCRISCYMAQTPNITRADILQTEKHHNLTTKNHRRPWFRKPIPVQPASPSPCSPSCTYRALQG
jgi:hypothetical protein